MPLLSARAATPFRVFGPASLHITTSRTTGPLKRIGGSSHAALFALIAGLGTPIVSLSAWYLYTGYIRARCSLFVSMALSSKGRGKTDRQGQRRAHV